jgi:hypothetical protein
MFLAPKKASGGAKGMVLVSFCLLGFCYFLRHLGKRAFPSQNTPPRSVCWLLKSTLRVSDSNQRSHKQ